MAATYRGVIFYPGSDEGSSVVVRKYKWAENALILYFDSITEIIPFHAFTKASFESLPEFLGNGGSSGNFCKKLCRFNNCAKNEYAGCGG